ncbi:hypothetical protein MRX96_007182 [Rhipicephalus microplus]
MKNIALAFLRMGHLVDAVTSLEYIMAERADFRSALHLVVCQYHLSTSSAVGGHDKLRGSFLKLLDVTPEQVDDKYEPSQVSRSRTILFACYSTPNYMKRRTWFISSHLFNEARQGDLFARAQPYSRLKKAVSLGTMRAQTF